MAYGTPGIHTHEQWLGLVQPVGLVVAPAVLTKLQLFPNQGTAYLSGSQRQLKSLLEERDHGTSGKPIQVVPSFQLLANALLDWGDSDLVAIDAMAAVPEVVLSEYGETLRPTHGVPKFEGEGFQALVLDLTQLQEWGREFDEPWNPTGHGWDATPQQRFERLLKETEHPIGILFNGASLRLVHAPRGESSGWLTIPLEPMAEVAGRPMLGALELLLGVDRLFGGSPEQRLPALLAASRKNQNEVSTRLAEQVLEALWELLLGFDEAERMAQESGRTILGDLPKNEEGQKHLYGGLITVLLRLVFLLYAEDEALMPADSLYGQHYSVSGLADRLRQERFEHQSGMADRRGAWASLLSLFRLVYDGGGADPNYLPARHGELFDPDAYPFLEGRDAGSSYEDGILTNLPVVSDDVVEKVLSRLLWLADDSKVAQRLSYRSLDVEQIGSVYEGIMGFTVEQAKATSVGITYRPPRQKITITFVVEAELLLAQSGSKREKWLKDQAGVKLNLPAAVKRDLKTANSLVELCLALDKKLSPHTPLGLQPGSLILQPTAERRRSGSHYTPRALTEPIVAEAFRPWLEDCNHQPTAEQILALKVCDPAMGSGAFLVAVCRFLAGWLVKAWDEGDDHKAPTDSSIDKDIYARRLIAQSCLYGVDKNPFAVNLAKLSLWLVTLSENHPFTFVDHALKCGDSLVGHSVKEIQAAMSEVQLGFLNEQNEVFAQMGLARRESFGDDALNDEGYDRKKVLLQQQIKATEDLRQAGDLMVAAFFDGAQAKERGDKQQMYLSMLSGAFEDEALEDSIQDIRERLASGGKGITPFHWDLEFPEVFNDDRRGFNVFIGNPPFAGDVTFTRANPPGYFDFLKEAHPESGGRCDLVAFFFRQCFDLLQTVGSMGLIATNTVAQGDTRSSGLRWICNNGGTIYSARKRFKWPGVAAVVVSILHIQKDGYLGAKLLDGKPTQQITAFLLENGGHDNPNPLAANDKKSFNGSKVYGQGFTFDNSDAADNETAGTPSRISTKEQLIAENPKNLEVIFPYIGGEEANESPTHAHQRYVIDFRGRSEEECRKEWPALMTLLEKKVKPQRQERNPSGEYKLRKPLPQRWWIHGDRRPALYAAIDGQDRVLVTSAAAVSHHMINSISSKYVFSHKLIVFPDASDFKHMCMQSLFHEEWSRAFGATQGSADALTYNPTDVFLSFPFPEEEGFSSSLSEVFSEKRSGLLKLMNQGPTVAYGRLNQPSENDDRIASFRQLHETANAEVAEAYGWPDICTDCGFGLEHLDVDDDTQIPESELNRLMNSELFFWNADDACAFQDEVQSITGSRGKLPWRYRWPDAVRDDVLARLLALNAERYAEEVAMGLHNKGAKSPTGKTRGRKPKTSQNQEASFQLEPEPYQAGFNLGL
jgi:hypothetical protein